MREITFPSHFLGLVIIMKNDSNRIKLPNPYQMIAVALRERQFPRNHPLMLANHQTAVSLLLNKKRNRIMDKRCHGGKIKIITTTTILINHQKNPFLKGSSIWMGTPFNAMEKHCMLANLQELVKSFKFIVLKPTSMAMTLYSS